LSCWIAICALWIRRSADTITWHRAVLKKIAVGLTGFLWWFCEFFAKTWWKDSQQIAQISETSPHKPCLRFLSVTQTCAQLDFGHMAMRYKKTRTNSWKTDDWIWTIWRGSAIGDALRPELRSEMLQILPDTFTDISGSPLYLQLQDIWICERFL
jgi:hypothetical protein